ncbi:hypothetical protein AN4474.2 [Aspergillus nidulans FGSC A4]|uniref:Uncharacterized protein n=1 Tax=Emericella nidulans (strain FGSC A4 / ATCC 38163 / CBS 112.46 / NRRL 194 / M139) TaxID=227321 RepID=Q5B4Q6_EMENI|nr:hypothetical protein [Aspergillus nidulans FGSC A4]EAA60817.1 hypothetical protein AN4474.2 [Aspergillus nidulans FGSC A4]CBF77436.1 TPA: conserved hypothetical protein [Aspergillus nidulans FGSC A4]|eukprot:XP_662078.1 hypothetical protein AN4474.2 [Aspergillus nidulans FGSC A4]
MDKDKSPRRHWHGNPGDRYEHHNVWVRGGAASSYRRPSSASASDVFGATDRRSSSASEGDAGARSPPPSLGERRRSSGHGPSSLFESLTSQKRNSNDGAFAQRRQSWNEQARPGGYFSKWWSEYIGGK